MTRRWRSLGTSSPEEAEAGAMAGASRARSGTGPASRNRPATTAQPAARRRLGDLRALSQGAIGRYTAPRASHGPYPVETGYGRAGAVSSASVTAPTKDWRMRPLGFLTGVVLGSAASIALVLLMIAVVFAFSVREQPSIRSEYPDLLASAGLFGALAATAAAAFVGLQRGRPWRWLAQSAMWLLLLAIAWYYWPAGAQPGG